MSFNIKKIFSMFMIMSKNKYIISSLIFLFLFSGTYSQEIETDSLVPPTQRQLKVGYSGSVPFIYHSGRPEGIIIDIWKDIAFELGYDFEYIPYGSVKDGISAVNENQIDLLIGPITINLERARQISFSQPFYNTELAILAPVVEVTIWDRLAPFFSINFLYAVFGLVFILTLVGFLVWLVERKGELEEFRDKPLQGIGIGVWLAIVTMTTVGYGDYSPKTAAGKVILGAWMIISLIMATSFVAGIASTLTASNNNSKTITSLNEIDSEKKVAVPSISRLSDNIRANGGKPIEVSDIDEALKYLNEGKIDAIVYDIIPLEYIYNKLDKKEYVLTTNGLYKQNYGFVFPNNSDIRREINLQILAMKESDEIPQIIDLWVNRE